MIKALLDAKSTALLPISLVLNQVLTKEQVRSKQVTATDSLPCITPSARAMVMLLCYC